MGTGIERFHCGGAITRRSEKRALEQRRAFV